MMDAEVQQQWEGMLDPDILRPRLISGSIYIAGFELLKNSIIDRIRSFLCPEFDVNGDISDAEYQSDVLRRNPSTLYASLDWLKDMGAINDEDIETFERVKTCRNHLTHRLFKFLAGDGLPSDFERCFSEMVALLHKIEVWWLVNVEIPTNPDFDGEDIDEDGIRPGPVRGLQVLCAVALGAGKQSRFYLNEFRKQSGK